MINYQVVSHKDACICLFENKFSSDELLREFEHAGLYSHELDNLKTENRKKEFLGLRLALKHCLKGKEKVIGHTQKGKPVLEDKSYNISFSHCRGWIAVITHPGLEVGIDIENPTQKLNSLYNRFLCEEELQEYLKDENFDYLRIIWSAKEALYKIIGDEAVNFKNQLHILPFRVEREGNITGIHNPTGRSYDIHYQLTDSYTLAWCIDQKNRQQ